MQEAADEDANIIFGAVVDPTLNGKVKITVIATGFGPPSAARLIGSTAQTPVDMTQYGDGIRLRADVAVPPALASGERLAMRRPSLPRRPVETPIAAALAAAGPAPSVTLSLDSPPANADEEESAAFDVPAFLRRPEG